MNIETLKAVMRHFNKIYSCLTTLQISNKHALWISMDIRGRSRATENNKDTETNDGITIVH